MNVFLLEGGDGFECAWVLGIYGSEEALRDEISKHFADFIEDPEHDIPNRLYRPAFFDRDESWEDREARIEAEIGEDEIRHGANLLAWSEYPVL